MKKHSEPIMAWVNERNNSNKPPEQVAALTFMQFVGDRWKAYTVSVKHQPSTNDCWGSLIKKHLLPHFGDRRL